MPRSVLIGYSIFVVDLLAAAANQSSPPDFLLALHSPRLVHGTRKPPVITRSGRGTGLKPGARLSSRPPFLRPLFATRGAAATLASRMRRR